MEHSELEPTSPAGQVERWGAFASGLRHNRSGRRRAAIALLWLLAAVVLATGLIVVLV